MARTGDEMAARAASDLQAGFCVNLAIGIPRLLGGLSFISPEGRTE